MYTEKQKYQSTTDAELRNDVYRLRGKVYDLGQRLDEHVNLVTRQRAEVTKNVLSVAKKTINDEVTQIKQDTVELSDKVNVLSEKVKSVMPKLDPRYLKTFNGGISLVNPISKQCYKTVNGEKHINALSNGTTVITGVEIRDRLEENRITVLDLQQKLQEALYKLENVNGFVSSNNFRTSYPTPTQLSNFVITQLSTESNTLIEENIPNGTKIKNTYDNHIWVFNNITVNGITTIKWEDLGSDTICTASNDGVKGLVTGSEDKFRGYIDLKGVISINGLEEELTNILSSLSTVISNLQNYQKEVNNRLDSIEKRLTKLEN